MGRLPRRFSSADRPGGLDRVVCTASLSVRRRWYFLNVLKRTLEGARDLHGQIEAAAAASCGVAALACTLWLRRGGCDRCGPWPWCWPPARPRGCWRRWPRGSCRCRWSSAC